MRRPGAIFYGVATGSFIFASAFWIFFARAVELGQPQNAGLSAAQYVRELPMELPSILETLYAAFNAGDESTVYDLLATVAHDSALESLYLERMLTSERAGLSASQSIHDIQIIALSSQVIGQSIEAYAQWRVLGTVGHAEHMHMRGNAYTAQFVLAPRDDGWRIVDFKLLDVDRSDVGKVEQHSQAAQGTRSDGSAQP